MWREAGRWPATHERQGAMPAHAVPRDGDVGSVELVKGGKERLGQLLRDVRVHFVVLGPRFLGRVDVEAGAGAKVVGLILALDLQAACARRGRQRDARLIFRDGVMRRDV